jgi:Fe-S-cluster containining protein
MSEDVDTIVEGFVGDLRNKIHEMAVRLLGPGRTPDSILALARNTQEIFDVTERSMTRSFPPKEPVVCAKGCAYCCHLLFFSDAPTVFLIADEVSRNLPPDKVEALIERLVEFEEMEFGLRMVPRPPCPLLMENLCQAYDVRPLVCRAQNSLRLSECEEKFRGERRLVVAHDIPATLWGAIAEGISAGLAEAGFGADTSLEFTMALRIALETPAAAERWLAGDPIFVPARPDEDEGGSGTVH